MPACLRCLTPNGHKEDDVNSQVSIAPDLQAQLEALLDTVWRCERQWRLDDRFDLILREEGR